jgi:hypothetical protein
VLAELAVHHKQLLEQTETLALEVVQLGLVHIISLVAQAVLAVQAPHQLHKHCLDTPQVTSVNYLIPLEYQHLHLELVQ